MMMKILLVTGTLILLAGCGNVSRTVAQVTGHSEVCVNHESYAISAISEWSRG